MKVNLRQTFPENIFVIGCGGTGARVAENLKYFISTSMARGYCTIEKSPTIWLVDHDIVETKNAGRQNFYYSDVGLLKCAVLKDRLQDFLKVKHIPEAVNAQTLGHIFTEDILKTNFCVISCLDNRVSASQVYFYILEKCAGKLDSETCWSYVYSGGETRKTPIKGFYRELEGEYTTPYVTTFLYGEYFGAPITPVKPHQVNNLLVDPGPVIGMLSNGTGCGLGEDQQIIQTAEQNNMAAFHVERVLNNLYLEGAVVNQLLSHDGRSEMSTPVSLDEILYPDEFPALKHFLGIEEDATDEVETETEEIVCQD